MEIRFLRETALVMNMFLNLQHSAGQAAAFIKASRIMCVEDDLLPAAGQPGLSIARFPVDVPLGRGHRLLRGNLCFRFRRRFRQFTDQNLFIAFLSVKVPRRLLLPADQDRIALCPAGIAVRMLLRAAGQFPFHIARVRVGVFLHSAGQARLPRPIAAVRMGVTAALFGGAGQHQFIARIRVDMSLDNLRGIFCFRKRAVFFGTVRFHKATEQLRIAVAGCAVNMRLHFR